MVPESQLEKTEHGLVQKGDGWYVLNLRDAVWRHPFVLGPGEPMGMHHWETDQEDFLVVSGEAVLIVEGEERTLRVVGSRPLPAEHEALDRRRRTGPCLVVALRARERSTEPDSLGFPVDDVATRHGASVEEDTMDGDLAYAPVPPRNATGFRPGWLPDERLRA